MLKFKFFALTNTIQFIEIRQTSSPHTFDSQLKGADKLSLKDSSVAVRTTTVCNSSKKMKLDVWLKTSSGHETLNRSFLQNNLNSSLVIADCLGIYIED